MFRNISHWSFRGKLLLAAIVLSLILPTIGGVVLVNQTTLSHKELIFENAVELASTVAKQIYPAVEFDDEETATEIINAIVENPVISSVEVWKFDIFEPHNKPYLFAMSSTEEQKDKPLLKLTESTTQDQEKWTNDSLLVQRIVYSQNQQVGLIRMNRSLFDLQSMQNDYKNLTLTIWVTIVILVIILSFWLEKNLTKPLLELVCVAEKISTKNDLQIRATKLTNDEFGRLTSVFNAMLDSIGDANTKLLKSKAEVDSKVIERTDDLNKANKQLQAEIKVRIKKNKELLSLQNQLGKHERFASVGQVSSNIAHELRNPMAAIRNSVYFLRKSLSSTDKSIEHLDLIDQQLSESDLVIKRLLDITKGKALDLRECKLKDLCHDAIEVLDLTKEINFSYNSEPENLKLFVDKLLFRQILSNLFINSIQSKDPFSQTDISVFAERVNEFVDISIVDNGPGIPTELAKRVFEPLYTSKKEGFGLGLPLCADLLERHRGVIEIKETSPKGTIIYIRIPHLEKTKNKKQIHS